MTTQTSGLSSNPTRVRSKGPKVAAWIEKYLVHAEGDFLGQPFRLTQWQKDFLNRLYIYDDAGNRVVKRGLLGLPKGNGKTELLAAIALAELAGPTAPLSPDIPVAAASYQQANLLFSAARTMVSEGPLKEFFDLYEDRIIPKGRPGRLYKVAAEAGTNDGSRPTCFIADEVHEWTGRKERVHLVIGNSLAKRQGSVELNISTAGFDKDSLLYRLYTYGKQVQSGEITDPGFLFVWHEADNTHDLTDPDQLLAAIHQANPAADDFWPASNLVRRYHEIPEFEFRRYHLNNWTSALAAWLPQGTWEACEVEDGSLNPGDEVVLGFDGSYNGDSTALVAVTTTPTPHVEVIGCWERPETDPMWKVDVLDVMETIRQTCQRYKVREIASDPFIWRQVLEQLADEGLPVTEFPQTAARMVPATQRFYEAVVNGALTHNPDSQLARHVGNARLKVDSRGPRLSKESKASTARIDLAVAAVMALERATAHEPRKPTPRVVDLDSYLT